MFRLETLVPLPPTGVRILEAFAREDAASSLASFFEAWTSWAADVALSFRAFPVLAFFRSGDSRCEWLATLGAVLDAASLMDSTVARSPSGTLAGSHAVIAAGSRLIAALSRKLFADEVMRPKTGDRALFATWRDRLSAVGYALVEDERQAAARFSKSRAGYARDLNALAGRLHIDLG